MARLHILVEVVRRPDLAKGFVLLPKLWRVEQAFGAGRFCRRLLVDHETLPRVSEAMIRLGSIMRFVHALTESCSDNQKPFKQSSIFECRMRV